MWKHLTSSLWMNATDFIFRLLHIHNLPTLVVLIPPHLPCTPFVDYAHFSANYVNSFIDYENTSVDCANNFDDCDNTFDDWANTLVDLACTLNIPSLDFYIPNPSLLQLLFTNLLFMWRLKIKMCSSLDLWFILHLQHSSSMVSIFHIFHCPLLCQILHLNSTCTLFPIY
jgi:hypothetical protein